MMEAVYSVLKIEAYVRFQVLTVASVKFRVFCVVVTLKWTDVSEVRTASIIRPTSLIHDPDDGGSKHF
jgi:hypothetical protein